MNPNYIIICTEVCVTVILCWAMMCSAIRNDSELTDARIRSENYNRRGCYC